jgi:hypothetical protein
MQTQHGKLIEALNRVEQFLDTNPSAMAGIVTSTAHQQFSASRQRLVEHMTSQNEHQRGIRTRVIALRLLRTQLIQQHMRPIAILAKAQLPVGERSALTVPSTNRSFVAFVAAGAGMARAARVHEATFLAAGFPADFIEALLGAAEALNQGITTKGESVGLRVKATGGLKAEARVARTNLKLLDTRIRGSVTDGALLAQWRNIRRVVLAATSPRALGDASGVVPRTDASNTSSEVTPTPQEVPAAA